MNGARKRGGELRCTVGWETVAPGRRASRGTGRRRGARGGVRAVAGASAMNAAVVRRTQEALGKVIRRPPLTEKLLNKPPFRYLHDIITEVGAGLGAGQVRLRSRWGEGRDRVRDWTRAGVGCRTG